MDNFKFMDSWPARVRWVTSIVLPVASLVLFAVLALNSRITWTSPIAIVDLVGAAAIGCSFLFVWSGTASAPRFKLLVAVLLGLGAFILGLDPAGDQALVVIAPGVMIAWGLVFWGYLRRRRAGLASR
jgi:hypothetical protein